MPDELNGYSRPRPLRVAFLVQQGEHADLTLDGIFADCYGRWGGRFSLIVPCIDGRIDPAYWEWLTAYDPDIVYSYVPLSRADILEIHERLAPADYHFHKFHGEPRLDTHGFKPSFRFKPLASLSNVFRLARHSPANPDRSPLKIIDSWFGDEPSRFLTDNFGSYWLSRGTSIFPADASAAASLLTVISPERLNDRHSGVPRDLNTIPNDLAALQEFAGARATSLSLLSILFAPKLDLGRSRLNWSGTFNLVIGETFSDRILFWNARHLIPSWLDNQLCAFRVGLDQLRDHEFLTALGALLKHRNYVNAGSGGQSQLTIRSTSLSDAELAEARELILSTKPWGAIAVEKIASLHELVPSDNELKDAREVNRLAGELLPRPDWSRFTWTAPEARPPATPPDHLSDAPIRQAFIEGYWCNDFVFQFEGPGPRFGPNYWALPRRWRMARAFKVTRVAEPQFSIPPLARRSRHGYLTVFVSADHSIESIVVPKPFEAMAHALITDGSHANAEADGSDVYPQSKFPWMSPSNEARYLTGVLGLADGLAPASQVLLHPFLQRMFARFGGAPNPPSDGLQPIVNTLRKRARANSLFDLKRDSDVAALAELIVKASRQIKKPVTFIKYADLKEDWRAHRAAYWEKRPEEKSQGDDDVDWDKDEQDSLDECLIEMRSRQILFQGHQWTCRRCHHKNWMEFSSLSSELSCEICNKSVSTPIDIQWLFRANEFLIESLRDHSVLSLVWVLSALSQRSRRSFIFVEPTKFGNDYQSDCAAAEADLLVLLDGEAVVCEVKSSWTSVRQSHIADFVSLAGRLRPNTALLAVMDTGAGPKTELAGAEKTLSEQGINFELLTLDKHEPDDDSYLRFNGGYYL
jgi:hypothetical protein